MTNEPVESPTQDVEALEKVATLGAILKTTRENKGLSLETVALQLHLRPKILADIEADNFDNIASNTYARGYIKNYARFIDADMDAIKQCLDQQITEYVPPTMQSFSRKTTREARDSRLNLMTYVIVIILLGMLVLWWVQQSDSLTESGIALPTVEEIQANTVTNLDNANEFTESNAIDNQAFTDNEPVQTDSELVSSLTSTQNQAANPAQSVEPNDQVDQTREANEVESLAPSVEAVAAETSSSSASETTSTTSANSTVKIDVTSDCWINLVDVTGKVLVDGVKTAGHKVNVSGQAPFKLILGAPQGVTLSIDGENVSLSQYENGKVARLTLTKPE